MLPGKNLLLIGLAVALLVEGLIWSGCARQVSIPLDPKEMAPTVEKESPTSAKTEEIAPTTEERVSVELVPTVSGSATKLKLQSEESEATDYECYRDPRKALDDFLSHLHNGEYEQASSLYGGDSFPLQRAYLSISDMEFDERIGFLTKYFSDFCEGYGTCLQHQVVSQVTVAEDATIFNVRFFDKNGEVFVFVMPLTGKEGSVEYRTVGPEFEFRVEAISGCYKSLDFPPITP
jgi:hypothetical protein